jgi:hypothetical protein
MTHDIQTGTTLDPFNPAALRLDPSYAEAVGVRRHLTTVPVRKPNRQDFVRVHPDPSYRLSPAAIVELKEDRETYLITPAVAQQLPDEFAVATLLTAINRQGVLFIWPLKLPSPDGKQNDWHRSAAAGRSSDRNDLDRGKGREAQGAGGLRGDQLCRDAGLGREGARADRWPRRRLRRRDRRAGNDREIAEGLGGGRTCQRLIGARCRQRGTMLDPLLLTGRGITVGAISVGRGPILRP